MTVSVRLKESGYCQVYDRWGSDTLRVTEDLKKSGACANCLHSRRTVGQVGNPWSYRPSRRVNYYCNKHRSRVSGRGVCNDFESIPF
jgi:hypothetical protein